MLQARPVVGRGVACADREGKRAPGGFGDAAHMPQACSWQMQVLDDLEHALALVVQCLREREEFVVTRIQRGHRLPVAGAVEDGARGGDAHGAGVECLGEQRAHARDVFRCGRLAVRAALPHHVHAQRCVRHVAGDVHVVLA